MFAVFALCSEREARQLWHHKIQFQQFSNISTIRSVCKAKKKGHFQSRISRQVVVIVNFLFKQGSPFSSKAGLHRGPVS